MFITDFWIKINEVVQITIVIICCNVRYGSINACLIPSFQSKNNTHAVVPIDITIKEKTTIKSNTILNADFKNSKILRIMHYLVRYYLAFQA